MDVNYKIKSTSTIVYIYNLFWLIKKIFSLVNIK